MKYISDLSIFVIRPGAFPKILAAGAAALAAGRAAPPWLCSAPSWPAPDAFAPCWLGISRERPGARLARNSKATGDGRGMQASRPPATPPWQPSRATLPAPCFLAVRAPAPKDRRHHCHSRFQSREKGEMRESSG